MSSTQLGGRTVLITGVAGGIGQVLCKVLAERSAWVCGLDRDEQALAKLATKQPNLKTIVADLTDANAVKASIDRHQKEHGAFDCLVNNAAFIHDLGSLAKTTATSWKEEIDANLNGCYNITSAMLETLSTNSGRIVTISSVNGLTSLGHPAYSAAKAAVVSYARAVAMEYGKHGVRSNIILPGAVATKAWQKRQEEDPNIFNKLKKWYPLGRVVEPSEIATAVCFLLSDDSSAISGAILNVDCGLMAGIGPLAEQLTLESFN